MRIEVFLFINSKRALVKNNPNLQKPQTQGEISPRTAAAQDSVREAAVVMYGILIASV